MRGGRQSRCGPSSGPTAPRATSTERLIGTSTHRAGMLFYTIFMASCIMCRIFSRWGVEGNAKSPAYGTLNDYQFMRRHTNSSKRQEKAKQCWGASLSKIDDVNKVFVKYAQGMPAPALCVQPDALMALCCFHRKTAVCMSVSCQSFLYMCKKAVLSQA